MMRRWISLALALALAAGCGEGDATSGAGSSDGSGDGGTTAAPVDTVDRAAIVAAYDKAIDFYKSKIDETGAVSLKGRPNVGFTALAAAAIAMRPGGVRAEDRDALDRALDFIAGSQQDNGGLYADDVPNYSTSVSVLALTEGGRAKDDPTIERAVQFLKGMQFDEDAESVARVDSGHPDYGGIGYGSSGTPDLSNTHYALEALRAGGVAEDDEVFKKVVAFLERNQNLSEYNPGGVPLAGDATKRTRSGEDGGAGYMPGDSKAGVIENEDGTVTLVSYGSMTYALLKCYIYAGVKKDDPRVQGALRWIRANWTWDENPGFKNAEERRQGLYYYYGVAGLALRAYGEPTIEDTDGVVHDWRWELAEKVISLQRADGTWMNENDRWAEALPEVATAHALLALASCAGE